MEKYCSFCNSKIFDEDRTCPQCGAPIKNYIIKEQNFVYKKYEINSEKENHYSNRSFGELSIYSDIRFIDMGDSCSFNIKSRDIFSVLRNGRKSDKLTEIHRQFEGQISIVPILNSFNGKDISKLFSSTMNCISGGLSLHRYSGFTISDLTLLSQKISAWNGGEKVVVVGTPVGLLSVLPPDSNYCHFIENYEEINFIENFHGISIMSIPNDNGYTVKNNINDNQLWIVSPTDGKLLKIVSENQKFEYIGIGLGINSVVGTMRFE